MWGGRSTRSRVESIRSLNMLRECSESLPLPLSWPPHLALFSHCIGGVGAFCPPFEG